MSAISIVPHDPIISRDGRPLESGARMRSAGWIYPSVLAGSLRTLLGKALAPARAVRPFDDESLLGRLKAVSVAGPLPCSEDKLYVPAPRDLLVYEERGVRKLMPLRPLPLRQGEGCDQDLGSCWPIALSGEAKPAPVPSFWSVEKMEAWLSQDEEPCSFPVPPEQSRREEGFFDVCPLDERIHVQIDPHSFTSAEGMLFSTEGLVFLADEWPGEQREEDDHTAAAGVWLGARVESSDPELQERLRVLDCLHPLGGERRLAHFKRSSREALWCCPEGLSRILERAAGVRMVLATPGIFAGGWLPGWLDPETLEGVPPQSEVRLKLCSACMDRWRPISGWSLEKGRRGPKPVRRMVPAGSVYFFKVLGGEPRSLARQWLRSVADEAQDRRDGFALSLWGVWNHKEV